MSGTKVAALGEDGILLDRDESLRRLATFEGGPCPVMEACASPASHKDGHAKPHVQDPSDETQNHLIRPELPTRSVRRKPVLHVVTRMISEGLSLHKAG